MLASAGEAHPPFHPSSPEEKEAVRSQMERLLRSAHFRNSRRYPTLLRYIVEETLEGRGAALKERTLGVEVFARAPDYDTSSDPIVRVTVAEIRKRIAQYYHEDAHASELRIELTPGSYLPEFIHGREAEHGRDGEEVRDERALLSGDTLAESSAEPESIVVSDRRSPAAWAWVVPVVFAVALVACAAAWRWLRPAPLDEVWGPVFAKGGPITYCLPVSAKKNGIGEANTTDQAIAHALDFADPAVPASGTFLDHELLGENVVYSDVQAMMQIEPVVEAQHRPVRVRLNLGTNLNELREGPAIFLGGLDNQWTLQMIAPLRYRFAGSDADRFYVMDARNPANHDWSVIMHDKWVSVNHDYAIVARIHSEAMGQSVMVAAGVGMSGTAAAGEFLADPNQAAELRRRMGRALKDRDFEVVLRTDVVNGIAGPAQIVALDVR